MHWVVQSCRSLNLLLHLRLKSSFFDDILACSLTNSLNDSIMWALSHIQWVDFLSHALSNSSSVVIIAWASSNFSHRDWKSKVDSLQTHCLSIKSFHWWISQWHKIREIESCKWFVIVVSIVIYKLRQISEFLIITKDTKLCLRCKFNRNILSTFLLNSSSAHSVISLWW